MYGGPLFGEGYFIIYVPWNYVWEMSSHYLLSPDPLTVNNNLPYDFGDSTWLNIFKIKLKKKEGSQGEVPQNWTRISFSLDNGLTVWKILSFYLSVFSIVERQLLLIHLDNACDIYYQMVFRNQHQFCLT
jgi:hypothetical protein